MTFLNEIECKTVVIRYTVEYETLESIKGLGGKILLHETLLIPQLTVSQIQKNK